MDVIKFLNELKDGIAVLIDPDKFVSKDNLSAYLDKVSFANPDMILIGGSTVSKADLQNCVKLSKEKIKAPIVIFPGASHQLSEHADAILFLSLISGRNSDYLIGHHIAAVSELENMNLQIIPTSYMLIDGGKKSSVEYVSNTNPIPKESFSIARKTALAGKYLGHKILYADAGSGAKEHISKEMITLLASVNSSLIIGGGIRSIEQIKVAHKAGAKLVVIGNKIEEDIDFLLDIKNYRLDLSL